jgi:hypothetical protein
VSTTITISATPYTIAVLEQYRASRRSRNTQHAILGTNEDAVALRPAGLRTGRIRALFLSAASATAAHDALCAGSTAALASTGEPSIDMNFVLADGGDASIEIDPVIRTRRWVEFDYQEINP